MKTAYKVVTLAVWQHDDSVGGPSIQIERYSQAEELLTSRIYPLKNRLNLLRTVILYCNDTKVTELYLK